MDIALNIKSIAVFALLFIITSCKSTKTDDNKINYVDQNFEYNSLKNYGMCQCLYKALPLNKDQRANDGSSGGYFQISSLPIERFEETLNYVTTYLDSADINSSTNSNLAVKRCLDLYNSNQFHVFIREQLQKK